MLPDARVNDLVLAVSAILGFGIGAFLAPTWQDAVETGQVIAGVVSYPHDNPLYGYHIQVWTIVCQIAGLLLALGIREHAASVLVSGAMGACAFAALAQMGWAFSRNGVIALAAPCLAFATYQTADQYGVVYPIFAMGNRSTHGIIAMSSAALVLGLWGAGRLRGAAFLTGLLPALHPIMAAWCWGVLIVSGALQRDQARAEWKQYAPWFAVGFGIAAASFAVQMVLSRHVPDLAGDVQEQFRAAYTQNWDLHRTPVEAFAPGMIIVYGTTALAFVMLRFDTTRNGAARLMASACVVSLALAGVSWVTGFLPSIVGALMPGRFVNPVIFLAPAVVVGVLGRYGQERWAQVLLLAHVGFTALTRIFPGEHVVFRESWHWIEIVVLMIATALCIGASNRNEANAAPRYVLCAVAVLTILALGASTGRLVRKGIDPPMLRRQNDPFMAEIARGEGLLLTASNIGQVQVRARRAVVINGAAIDYLPYFPETGPAMNQILTELYGVDLLGDPPPPDADYARYLEEMYGPNYMEMREEIPELNPGQLPTATGRDLWEGWSAAEWRAKADEFGFTQVLAFASWEINLPEAARDGELVLYDVPAE